MKPDPDTTNTATDAADPINRWLMSEGRMLGDGVAIVESFVTRLVAAGVPLDRANIAQRFANPLLAAWGIVWTPAATTPYTVTHARLTTTEYKGSPFETVVNTGVTLRKRLVGLDPDVDHSAYLDLADGGGTDMVAIALKYGDGSVNGSTFVTNHADGFSDWHIDLIEATREGLACAMEPVTVRKSTESLLQTYLGDGPARAVNDGTIQRGASSKLDAVVMFSDLRGFTQMSERWSETALLSALDGYFDLVVHAVRDHGGDVLKFMGDGILSIFPIDAKDTRQTHCRNAVDATRSALSAMTELNETRASAGEPLLAMGIGINRGTVTYGNIGSPDRLDFTVLGPAVNVASRVQDLCKGLDTPVLATASVATLLSNDFVARGRHSIRGVDQPIEVFGLKRL